MTTMEPSSRIPWISTLQFCLDETRDGGALLASRSGGSRGPGNAHEWWPQVIGRPSENAGNVLVVDALPARVHLNVYFIACGVGSAPLRIGLFPGWNRADPLLVREIPLRFDPSPASHLPELAAMQTRLDGCEIPQAGLYWLVADVGTVSRIPLWVTTRDQWQEIADAEAVREFPRQHGIGFPE